MDRLRLTVAPDGMQAEVEVTPGLAIGREALDRALQVAGVVHGRDPAALDRLAEALREPTAHLRLAVAHGTPMQPGTDGALALAPAPRFATVGGPAEASIDLRERDLLRPADYLAEVARWTPPVPGTPGRTVLGHEVPPPAPATGLPALGGGVRLEPDGRIVALRAGVVHFLPAVLDVLELWQHKGNVGVASGNLHTRGSLHIQGDVEEGGLVEADGELLLHGAVFSGRVRAGGHLAVRFGVMGTGSVAQAGGDLACRHATNAELQAAGTLRVRDELVHCRVRATDIELCEGRGRALGGELRAQRTVRVRIAGSSAGAETLLSTADLGDQAAALAALARDAERTARQAAKANLRGERGKGGKPGRNLPAVEQRLDAARQQFARAQRELLRHARIEILDTAHAGVRIQFGRFSRRLEEPARQTVFRFDPESQSIVEEQP